MYTLNCFSLCFTWDFWWTTGTAVPVVGLDGEHGLLPQLHGGHALVPALDHLGLAQVEAELVPPVSAGVKLGAVCEGADIVNKHLVSCPGGGSSFTRHLEITAYVPESRPSPRRFSYQDFFQNSSVLLDGDILGSRARSVA